MKRAPGMTLMEVLISLGILGLLGLILVRIFDVSRTAYATGTGRVALQQRARTAVQRISQQLTSAIPPGNASSAVSRPEPPVEPNPAEPPLPFIVFHVPVDAFDPRDPKYQEVRLLHQPSSKTVIRDRNTPGDPSDDQTFVRQVDHVTFQQPRANEIQLKVKVYGQVRGADNRERLQDYHLETVVQIPANATK